jgi:hypothetical protein
VPASASPLSSLAPAAIAPAPVAPLELLDAENVFSADFSHVVLPSRPSRPLTEAELDRAVEGFLDQLPTLAET